MLRNTCAKKRVFICIDGLNEWVVEHGGEQLDSVNELQQSPGTRTFVTGRPHILPEIKRRLAGRGVSASIGSKRGNIIRYLHVESVQCGYACSACRART